MKRSACLLASLAAGALTFSTAQGSALYSGGTYTQNFDSLPNTPENASIEATQGQWADDTVSVPGTTVSIIGWYLYHTLDPGAAEDGTNGHQRLRAGPGTQNTGAFWSFG